VIAPTSCVCGVLDMKNAGFKFGAGLFAAAISIAGVTPVFAEDSTALSLDTWDALSSLYKDPLDGLEVLETSGLFDANWTSDPNGFAKNCVNSQRALRIAA